MCIYLVFQVFIEAISLSLRCILTAIHVIYFPEHGLHGFAFAQVSYLLNLKLFTELNRKISGYINSALPLYLYQFTCLKDIILVVSLNCYVIYE